MTQSEQWKQKYLKKFGRTKVDEIVPRHDELGIPIAKSITTTGYTFADSSEVIDFIDDLIQTKRERAVEDDRKRIMGTGIKEFHRVFAKTKNNIMLQQDFEEIVLNKKRL